ncbi:MAG: addiction module toxin RelE [Parabacteroides sp.]
MEIKIFVSSEFKSQFKRLAKKYVSLKKDLLAFQQELLDNPELGIELFPNVRKIRMSIAAKGKGKRGGGRIITYRVDKQTDYCEITLLTIYDKSEIESVSIDFIKYLLSQL